MSWVTCFLSLYLWFMLQIIFFLSIYTIFVLDNLRVCSSRKEVVASPFCVIIKFLWYLCHGVWKKCAWETIPLQGHIWHDKIVRYFFI